MDMEIKFAIKSILDGSSDEKRQELIDTENEFFGINDIKLRQVINDLTHFFTVCVDCKVVDGIITIDESDPIFTDVGHTITDIDKLIACIG